jgi:hypothetical protein
VLDKVFVVATGVEQGIGKNGQTAAIKRAVRHSTLLVDAFGDSPNRSVVPGKDGGGKGRRRTKGDELAWAVQEPNAVLLDYKTGEKVGTHGKGPSWADDEGGKVNAKVFESVPAPRTGAVAWLLLNVTGEPTGRVKKVSHIQRIDTWAGQPPDAKPRREGEVKKVHYHATYTFWGER